MVLGFEPMTSCMLGKHCIIELHPQPFPFSFLFKIYVENKCIFNSYRLRNPQSRGHICFESGVSLLAVLQH